MAHGDRLRETSITEGAGAYTLLGAFDATFQTISTSNADDVGLDYWAQLGMEIEVGRGHLSAGTLVRDTIVFSTNANAPIDWGPGTKVITVGLGAFSANSHTWDGETFGVSGSLDMLAPSELGTNPTVHRVQIGKIRDADDAHVGDGISIEPTGAPFIGATALLTTTMSNGFVDGDFFTIDDGVHAPVKFEYDNNSSVTPTSTLKKILLSGSATTIRTRTLTAINDAFTAGDLNASAALDVDDALVIIITLEGDSAGTIGNWLTTTSTMSGVSPWVLDEEFSGGEDVSASDAPITIGAYAANAALAYELISDAVKSIGMSDRSGARAIYMRDVGAFIELYFKINGDNPYHRIRLTTADGLLRIGKTDSQNEDMVIDDDGNIGFHVSNHPLTAKTQHEGSVGFGILSTSTDDTIGANQHIVLVNCGAGNRTITIPLSTDVLTREYVFVKTDATANTLTIAPTSGTINGAASLVLTQQFETATINAWTEWTTTSHSVQMTAAGVALVVAASAAAQRTALELGTAATASTGDFDADGAASSAVSTHVGLPDPHTQYALESALGGAAVLNVGTTAGTVAAGDDSRITGAATIAQALTIASLRA